MSEQRLPPNASCPTVTIAWSSLQPSRLCAIDRVAGTRLSARLLAMLLPAVLLLAAPGFATAAVGRWALVVGNDAYQRVEPLRNAVADARLIAGELKRAGFEVTEVSNADRRTLLREVIDLARRAEGGGEVVIYFAGHGVQVANFNYLLPVDFDGADEAMLPFEAVSLTDIGNQFLDAKTRFSLLIIDACRNNPLAGRRGRNLRTGAGLAPMSPATGQMVVYSAGSGQLALDGLGERDPIRNGLFAREFAREMRTPGVDVRELMLTVRESVERLAASVNHAQRPAIYDESRGRFVFHAPPPAAATLAPGGSSGKSPDVIEDELWAAFSGGKSRAGFAAYLREYPSGRYAAAARVQLEVLGPVDPPATSTNAAAPVPAAAPPGATSAAAPAAASAATPAPSPAPAAASPPAIVAKREPIDPSSPAPASASLRNGLNGKRFRAYDGQYELTVRAAETGLLVESFSMTSGRLRGTQLRCGTFSSRIDLDAQLNVSAWCNGVALAGPLRLVGRFPRIDIFTGGSASGGSLTLAEIGEGR